MIDKILQLFKTEFLKLDDEEQENTTIDIANFLHKIKIKPVMTKIKEYVDYEIKELIENLKDMDIVLNNNISKQELQNISEKLKTELEVVDIKFVGQSFKWMYRAKLNVIFKNFEFKRTFEYLSMIGAFSESTHKYLFVGTNSGHPFIITDEFKYYNSNESGINFPNCDLCVDKQIEMLENFYKKFIKNKCY